MEDAKDLQEFLIQAEREIHDLKTAAKLTPMVRTFWATIEPTSQKPIIITYEDGSQPIITNAFCWSDIIIGTVQGNTQKVFYGGQSGYGIVVTVVSTRPILSITQ